MLLLLEDLRFIEVYRFSNLGLVLWVLLEQLPLTLLHSEDVIVIDTIIIGALGLAYHFFKFLFKRKVLVMMMRRMIVRWVVARVRVVRRRNHHLLLLLSE